MNLEYRPYLPAHFSPESRVWIYQCSRLLSMGEALAIEEKLNAFTRDWSSHGAPVEGAAFLFFGQFIILMADESRISVGGCSTDSSVRMIKELEIEFGISLFDRTQLAFVIKDKIQLLPLAQLTYALDNGFINADTLYFNNTVTNKAGLENNWIIPLKESWLNRKMANS